MTSISKRILKWLGIAAILVSTFLIVIFASKPENPDVPNISIDNIDLKNEWVKGNPDAKVVLLEYSDFQCPACKNVSSSLDDLVGEFGSHIAFVYRYFPLVSIHQNAMPAAQAAEAAGLQGKFWEMHDKLFATQDDWSLKNQSELKEIFISYAQELGLDVEKFKEDFSSSKVEKAVKQDIDSAQTANLNSTPSFFLNGKHIRPTNYENFRELIRQEIEKTNNAPQ